MDTPQQNPPAPPAPQQKPAFPPAPTGNVPPTPPSKLTGEARLNAVLRILQEKHGFLFPATVFDPKTDK